VELESKVKLKTNNGIEFLIDPHNFEQVSKHTWHFQRYIRTTINGRIIRLHNFLFGYAPKNLEWDHIDRDTRNNCQENLHLVTHSQNMRNKSVPRNNKSGTKGVCWHIHARKWIAQIKLDGKIKHLGYFINLQDAINIRKLAEVKYL